MKRKLVSGTDNVISWMWSEERREWCLLSKL